MIQVNLLETFEMKGLVDKVLHDRGTVSASLLLSIIMRELLLKPQDREHIEKQLRDYIITRLFEKGDIVITKK